MIGEAVAYPDHLDISCLGDNAMLRIYVILMALAPVLGACATTTTGSVPAQAISKNEEKPELAKTTQTSTQPSTETTTPEDKKQAELAELLKLMRQFDRWICGCAAGKARFSQGVTMSTYVSRDISGTGFTVVITLPEGLQMTYMAEYHDNIEERALLRTEDRLLIHDSAARTEGNIWSETGFRSQMKGFLETALQDIKNGDAVCEW